MKISLVGFMGCGKTTVGKILSENLNCEFVDIDNEIEKKLSMTIPEIFEKFGEEFFREKEKETFLEISNKENVVISTGGGFPAYKNSIEIINKNSKSIYLKTNFETIWERIKEDKNRPLVKLGKNRLKELFEKRKSFYEKAEIVVDTTNKTPTKIVDEILEKISKS